MRLITELNMDTHTLVEETNGKKHYYIEGVFLQSEIQNKNGRVYPYQIMSKEVNRYLKEQVQQNRAFGELGHPEGPNINLERVSHMITDLHAEGKNFIGKARIMEGTPYGDIAKAMLENGARLGVSSRGIGSVESSQGVHYVKEDFKLATAADIVADPSAPDAFVRGIMEGAEWVYDNGSWGQQELEEAKKDIERAGYKHLAEVKMNTLTKFFDRL